MIKKLYFENSQGKVEMFLGGAGPVRVTALSGLGNPEKKYNTVTFAGKNGQQTLSMVDQPRNIIISGDTDKAYKAISEMSPVLLERISLTLEEVFIYELGGLGYDFKNIIF